MMICEWKPCARPIIVKSIVTATRENGFGAQGQTELSGLDVTPVCWLSPMEIYRHCMTEVDGFYRRQLVLTTKGKRPAGRMDDPDLAQKMKAEVEGIFLWAFEGLQRLGCQQFQIHGK